MGERPDTGTLALALAQGPALPLADPQPLRGGVGRRRHKAHASKIVDGIKKNVGVGKCYTTTKAGEKIHLYADCKSLEPVALSRQKEWTLCAHCAHQEEKKVYDAADVLKEMLQDGA